MYIKGYIYIVCVNLYIKSIREPRYSFKKSLHTGKFQAIPVSTNVVIVQDAFLLAPRKDAISRLQINMSLSFYAVRFSEMIQIKSRP